MAKEMETQSTTSSTGARRVLKLRKDAVRHLSDAQLESLVEGRGNHMPKPDSISECDLSVGGCTIFC